MSASAFFWVGVEMEVANGVEEDGITYRVHLDTPYYIATVIHPNGKILIDSWHWAFEPRCGIDIADYNKAELVLDILINKMRDESIGSRKMKDVTNSVDGFKITDNKDI